MYHFQSDDATIQELLGDIQMQQSVQGSRSLQLYLIGYISIGLVVGILIFILVHTRKRAARQNFRLPQHRFPVSSRISIRSI